MSSTRIPQAIFPDLPRDMSVTDGKLSYELELGLASVFQALQKNFSNEGIRFPPLTQTQQNAIQSIYQPYVIGTLPLPINIPDISGATIFDSTNRVPKQFIITYDGSSPPNVLTASWKTFTVT